MPARIEAKLAAAVSQPPSAREVRAAVSDYCDRAGMFIGDLAAEAGYARSTVHLFMQGTYARVLAKNDLYVRAALWEFMQKHPLAGDDDLPEKILRTRDTRTVLGLAEEARRKRRIIIAEGPPGTSKTTALRWYVAERNRSQAFDAFYLRATVGVSGPDLLRRLCAAVGARRHYSRGVMLDNLVRKLKRRRQAVILVDEAQHLLSNQASTFEQLRDVLDLAGCGCILAGHFSFVKALTNGLGKELEQWLSRIDLHVHLRGLEEAELAELWKQSFGDELPRDVRDALVRFALARDRNFGLRSLLLPRGSQALPRRYLSIRRVRKFFERVEELRQLEANQAQPLAALARGALKLLMAPEGRPL